MKSLGADEVIDYKAQKFEDVIHDTDVVVTPLAKIPLIDPGES